MNRLPYAIVAVVITLAAATQTVRAQTAALPSPPPALQTAAFGSLHVARYGIRDGATPVVLIPDLACGPWEYAALIAHLGTSRAVYAVTLPGMDGAAAAPPPLVPRFERDVAEMLARLDIEHPVVVGAGFGGMLAIDLATQHPDAVAGTVVIDAAPVVPGTENFGYAERRAAAAAAGARVAKTPSLFLQQLQHDDRATGVVDPRLADAIALRQAASDPLAIAAWTTEEYALDPRAVLSQATAPFLAVVSTADGHEEERKTQTAVQFVKIPALTIVTIAPARRFVMLDAPAALAKAIDTFLAALP